MEFTWKAPLSLDDMEFVWKAPLCMENGILKGNSNLELRINVEGTVQLPYI